MKLSKSQIDRVSQLTGLKNATVQDLLESGWVYTETLNQMPKWQKPGLGKRFASAFTGDDGRSVMSHVVLATQEEGNEVLKRMLELIRTYKQVSVGDLFDLVDIRSTFREESWGWKSLEGAGVKRVKDGWELKFPEPEHLG